MKIPQEPAIADLPSSPSEAYALGFRHGWIDCFGAGIDLATEQERLGPEFEAVWDANVDKLHES